MGTYEVASSSLNVTEPGSASGSNRTLPTMVWYPASTATGAKARGPFPLLVFSQGYDTSVDAYGGLLEDWASAGYVVAAPTYPDTDPSSPTLNENDIVNHPADLRFVISAVVSASGSSNSAWSGEIDAQRVGLVGQSDGGDVSLAVAADSCCQDPRVRAVAVLSGAELASFGGRYFTGTQVPLLVVQGSSDTINPPFCSVQLYDAAALPKYYLDLLGAVHLAPYTEPGTADEQVVAKVTIDFFDGELAGQGAALAAIETDGNVSGVAQVIDGGSAPPASEGCPGAPG